MSAAASASPQERAPRAAGPLRLEKTVAPDPLTVGGKGVYTLVVTNTGDESAHDVTVTDNLDSHLSTGEGLPGSCTASGSTVTCGGSGTDLAPGASATYEIPVTVDPSTTDGTNIVNHATASSSDAQSAEAQTITIAQTQTNVKLTKTGPATVDPDGSYDYTFTVTNEGPSDAVDVTVEDNTDGLDLDIQDLPSECPPSGTTITCPLHTLAPGEEHTFTVRVHAHDDVPAGTVIPNCADVYTGSRETVTTDNHSCTTTAVTPNTASPTPGVEITDTPTTEATDSPTDSPTTDPTDTASPTPSPTAPGPSVTPAPTTSTPSTPHRDPSDQLADTGAPRTGLLAAIGLAFAALGTGAVLATRRARTRRH
ncbi:hypothetical protein [Streptomyces sp. NPDC102360]|uniref:DUF7507 domain-containing protein n=1 Tax=Streptomyces sp. NPDC102360 TaxID=3366160 RepID=UPI003800CD89